MVCGPCSGRRTALRRSFTLVCDMSGLGKGYVAEELLKVGQKRRLKWAEISAEVGSAGTRSRKKKKAAKLNGYFSLKQNQLHSLLFSCLCTHEHQ